MINEHKNNEPLDLSYLREMSGNSAEFMIEMLEAFQKQTPLYMQDLENAFAAGDWKATSEYAHRIKPTFHYVGRDDARELMQFIEKSSREQAQLEQLPAAMEAVRQFIKRLYVQLEEAKRSLAAE